MSSPNTTRGLTFQNWAFIVGLSLLTVTAVPIYIYYNSISWTEIALFVFWFFVTAGSITVGYHRLFAHNTYKANGFVRFLLVFFGSAAFQQSALEWASQHRQHHGKVDTEEDPYNIKQGFWHAHVGWLLFWKRKTDYHIVKDLSKFKLLANQDKYYHLWVIVCGGLAPVLSGMALGSTFMGSLMILVVARTACVYHSTFSINSVCHYFGKPTYDPKSSAKDHWLVAFLTMGEGFHNFHHRFPNDYRNGIRWYHWDPSKWMIAFFEKLGWATDLHRTPDETILAVKEAAKLVPVVNSETPETPKEPTPV